MAYEKNGSSDTSGLAIVSTGEYVPRINIEHATPQGIKQWAARIDAMVEDMTSLDEVDMAEVMLAAAAVRLKQLGKESSDIKRSIVKLYRQRGELLGDGQRGNPTGANQHRGGISDKSEIPNSTQSEADQRYYARLIAKHWPVIEEWVEDAQNPTVVAAVREIRRKTTRVELPPGGTATITHAGWEDWLPRQEPADLLLTDPPYATDVDDIASFSRSWLPVALGKVKPTGRAYVCVGAYPRELMAYLSIQPPDHLELAQVLVWTYRNTLGPTPKYDYFLNWQAVLYYRGVDAPPLDSPEMLEQCAVADIPHPARSQDRWHPWQKPDALAERFIRQSTQPGDTVIDPFSGSGTHLVAAARLGRHGRGCEINEETVQIALARGCSLAD